MTTEQLTILKDRVKKNIDALKKRMGWTQARIAEIAGVSEPSVSKYINGSHLPPLEFLVSLCAADDLKAKGIDLKLDYFIEGDFQDAGKTRENSRTEEKQRLHHAGFIGAYVCYLFDQGNAEDATNVKASRDVRNGVLSIFDEYDDVTGKLTHRAIAAFPSIEDEKSAFDAKARIDKILGSGMSAKARNDELVSVWKRFDDIYTGVVTFSEHHAYISLGCEKYGDHALIVLHSPERRAENGYLGGIGSLASVAHGMTHTPTAQKIILSKRPLNCSEELIADHLSLTKASISQEGEAAVICEFCRKLYANEQGAELFDEADKVAMLERRLNQLVKNYIEKNICCVGSVSEDEDRNIVKLIEQQTN